MDRWAAGGICNGSTLLNNLDGDGGDGGLLVTFFLKMSACDKETRQQKKMSTCLILVSLCWTAKLRVTKSESRTLRATSYMCAHDDGDKERRRKTL